MGNASEMYDPEKSTAPCEIHSLFPVLLFGNKHNNKTSALEKDTITSEQTKSFGWSKMEDDDGISAADNTETLDSADVKPHECAIGRKTLRQNLYFTRQKHTHMVEKQCTFSVSGIKST